ncbi:bombesin receptor subtype-3-like [Argopecten irradians]|uniref:bombesin receptor subtype-3-like n=1 Tax=Argopecten irradians TaxID=31199 RepID=UPI00371C580C
MSKNTSANYGFRYECLLYIPVLLGTIIGIPGNVLTIRFYGRRIKGAMTSTAVFLTSLAVFDMLSLLTNIPSTAIAIPMSYVDGWKDYAGSSIEIYVMRIPRYWSNMTLFLIGIERVISVVLPHKMHGIFTRRVGVVSVVIVVLLGPVILFPLAIEPPLTVVPTNGTVTHVIRMPHTLFEPDLDNALVVMVSLCYFGIPIFGVLISNTCLMIALIKRYKSKHANNVRNEMSPSQVKELRTTKLVMVVTVIFIVCVFPLVIIYPIISGTGEAVPITLMLIIPPVSSLLETLNYSMNFFVYYIGSANFRTETRATFSRLLCCFKPTEVAPADTSRIVASKV